MEYLLTMTTRVPEGTLEEDAQEIRRREAARSRELAARGHLLRLWRPPLQPGEWRSLGLFAAAAFWEQAVALTPNPGRRASRALTAAEAKYAAGDFEAAQVLLATAEIGPLGELTAAQVQRTAGASGHRREGAQARR